MIGFSNSGQYGLSEREKLLHPKDGSNLTVQMKNYWDRHHPGHKLRPGAVLKYHHMWNKKRDRVC